MRGKNTEGTLEPEWEYRSLEKVERCGRCIQMSLGALPKRLPINVL
jgi:hypothetical protein